MLVLRDANGEISVPPELIDRWAVGRDDVIDRACENLLSIHLPVQRDQTGITAWSGEYAAAQVAVLAQRVQIDPDLGALVAFPGQEVLVAVPIADEATLGALLAGKFARFLDEVIGRTTSPLSGALYWWDKGRIVEIPVERSETGARHWLPEELAQRLAARFGGSGLAG
jgi:hypothetical protein